VHQRGSKTSISSAAKRAYWWGVVPVAALVGASAVWGLATVARGPAGFVPFVHNPTLARLAVGALSVALVAIALGLLYRSRAAWWALMALNALGHLWYALGCLFDPGLDKLFAESELLSLYPPELLEVARQFLFFLLLLLGIVFTIVIYFATRAAFRFDRSPAQ